MSGGIGMHQLGEPLAFSQARMADTFGVLKLSLRESRHEWMFHPAGNQTYTDSGAARCH